MFYLSCLYRPKMSHTLTTNLALWRMSWLAKRGSKSVAFCFAHLYPLICPQLTLFVIKPRKGSYDWFTRRMWSKLNVAQFPVRTPEVAISTFKENALLLPGLPSALCWQVLYMCVKHTSLWADLQCQWFRLNLRPQITDPRTGSIYLHCWGCSTNTCRLNTKCPQVVQTLRAYWNIICLPFTLVMDKQTDYMLLEILSLYESIDHQSRAFFPSWALEPARPLFCPARVLLSTWRSARGDDEVFFRSRVLRCMFKNLPHSSNPQDHAISSAVCPALLQMLNRRGEIIIGKVFIFTRMVLLRMMFALTGK